MEFGVTRVGQFDRISADDLHGRVPVDILDQGKRPAVAADNPAGWILFVLGFLASGGLFGDAAVWSGEREGIRSGA
jgi:hypothetical protein